MHNEVWGCAEILPSLITRLPSLEKYFLFKGKILSILIYRATYQNTCSVVLEQLTTRITFVVTFEEALRIPHIEARIVFFLQVITLRSNAVHSLTYMYG